MKQQLLLVLALASVSLAMAKDIKVTSPNGKVSICLSDRDGTLSYTASRYGKAVFTQHGMQMRLTDKTLGQSTKIKGVTTKMVNSVLHPVVALKQSTIKNNYKEATLTMRGGNKIVFRVFDNAVAYRYILNEKDSVYVVDESFNLSPTDSMNVHFQGTNEWGSASEQAYTNERLAE